MSADTHIRKTLRTAFATALRGVQAFGGRVHDSRAWPLSGPEDLPCALVHIDSEEVDTRRGGKSNVQTRTCRVVVTVLVAATESAEDQLDALGAQAETAIFSDTGIHAIAPTAELIATDTAMSADGSDVIGRLRMLFTAPVRVVEGHPETRAQ